MIEIKYTYKQTGTGYDGNLYFPYEILGAYKDGKKLKTRFWNFIDRDLLKLIKKLCKNPKLSLLYLNINDVDAKIYVKFFFHFCNEKFKLTEVKGDNSL